MEKVQNIDLSGFKDVFTSTELLEIKKKGNEKFYELWTKKEAFSKAVGKGLSINLKHIKVEEEKIIFENETWNDGDDDDMTIVNKELETRIATVRDKAKTIFDPLSENNDVFYGIYGYTDEFTKGKKIKKFSIVKIIESADKRVLSTGKDCTSWVGADSKMQLEYILTTLGSSSTEAGKNLGERCNKIETLFNDKGILLRNI